MYLICLGLSLKEISLLTSLISVIPRENSLLLLEEFQLQIFPAWSQTPIPDILPCFGWGSISQVWLHPQIPDKRCDFAGSSPKTAAVFNTELCFHLPAAPQLRSHKAVTKSWQERLSLGNLLQK